MDLNQTKLTKSEWNSIEVPVSEQEKEILHLIIRGYKDVNIKYNKSTSLFSYLKIEYNEEMEDHLYNKYFTEKISLLYETYKYESLNIKVQSNPKIKKSDIIRISKNDVSKITKENAYEYLMIETIENILKYKKKKQINIKKVKQSAIHL